MATCARFSGLKYTVGGGGGGFAKKTFSNFEGDGASYTITIGTGGADGNRHSTDDSAPGEDGFVYVEWN